MDSENTTIFLRKRKKLKQSWQTQNKDSDIPIWTSLLRSAAKA